MNLPAKSQKQGPTDHHGVRPSPRAHRSPPDLAALAALAALVALGALAAFAALAAPPSSPPSSPPLSLPACRRCGLPRIAESPRLVGDGRVERRVKELCDHPRRALGGARRPRRTARAVRRRWRVRGRCGVVGRRSQAALRPAAAARLHHPRRRSLPRRRCSRRASRLAQVARRAPRVDTRGCCCGSRQQPRVVLRSPRAPWQVPPARTCTARAAAMPAAVQVSCRWALRWRRWRSLVESAPTALAPQSAGVECGECLVVSCAYTFVRVGICRVISVLFYS